MSGTFTPNALRFLALMAAVGGPACCAAATPVEIVTEEQARAGFLFQLAQYVQWPAEAFQAETTPLRFCVLGQDSLVSTLESTVRGKSIQGRSIQVTVSRQSQQLSGCHLAFIGFSRAKDLRELLSNWPYPPVLLVGETGQFAEMGGMVNLILQGGRVSFEINTEAAERAHLVFRSQLLRFARIVGSRRGTP